MNLSSALRLGIECEILPVKAPGDLNKALIQVLPAHLQHRAKKRLGETDLAVMRAEVVRTMVLRKIRKPRTET
jgi:protein-arginine kinase